MNLLELIFGDLNKKEVKKIEKIVDKIEALDESMQQLSDDDLKHKTIEFKERLANGETLDDILPEAFAVCREAAWRSLGMKHFPVQLIGGVALHQGRISEMKTGEGKAIPLNTKIPTPTGWKLAGDIKIGDNIFGKDGTPTKVTGVYPQGKKAIYEIELKDGRVVKCAEDHLWSVYKGYNRKTLHTLSTKELMTKGVRHKTKQGERGYNFLLPVNNAVEYPEKQFSLPPYVLGAFLGNGCITQSDTLEISSADESMIKYIAELLNAEYSKRQHNYSWNFRFKDRVYSSGKGKDNLQLIHAKDLCPEYSTLLTNTYSFEKYIPEEYKLGSIEQRWELIRGLFDTDGSIDKTKKANIVYSTSSPQLRDDIMEILYSLGISCSWYCAQKAGTRNATHDSYTICVNAPNTIKPNFFNLPRKKEIANAVVNIKKKKDYSKISIVDIRKTDKSVEQVCFTVDAEDHLFLIDNYIVTHNTLVATLPAYLNALEGKGVHIVTVNDYLAKRDAEWMGKLYNYLGLSVGCVIHGVEPENRHAQYMADITYGTNNEFGFDYLRDNMVIYKEELTQRELNYAIVDEVDSILIDEARTPLIISGRGVDSSSMYIDADNFVKTLKKDEDYTIEEKDKQIALTENGIALCEKYFNIENFSDPDNMELNHYIHEALHANYLMKRDVDYIVKDGEILIVDEFTGRLMYGRRFSNGLHQAIEAKEHVKINAESKTLATITLQNYFRMYNKLAGMTGTAKTEEDEFKDIYNMDVVVIPTNKPIAREDLDDSIYASKDAKYKAIVNKIVEVHKTGQPILVGTISVEISELISSMLKKRGIKHNVLNAKYHEKEAEIIADAGRLNAVTIATNMAGRGTDIILGGNPDFEARKILRKEKYTPEQILFATSFEKTDDEELLKARDRYNELLSKIKVERKAEQEQVIELGGLCIIGTERHESRRIDNQLRGRSGRQGDSGNTQFYISVEDDLMRLFGGDRVQNLMNSVGFDEEESLEFGMLSRSIENAQKKVEGKNFGIRKYVLQYDNVMNKQREIIYGQRQKVLDGEDISAYIMNMIYDIIDNVVDSVTSAGKYPEEWDYERIEESLANIVPQFKDQMTFDEDYINNLSGAAQLKEDIKDVFDRLYEEKEQELGIENMRNAERMILLRVVDNRWMDHIDAMDQLKEGIGLRGVGQQDPATAYAQEGFAMFDEMISDIREETVKYCYAVTPLTKTERKKVISDVQKEQKEEYKEKKEEIKEKKQETVRRTTPKIGRNDPCPCGSGKKYKHCCGRNQ